MERSSPAASPPGRFKRWVASHVTAIGAVLLVLALGLIVGVLARDPAENWWRLLGLLSHTALYLAARQTRREVADYDRAQPT